MKMAERIIRKLKWLLSSVFWLTIPSKTKKQDSIGLSIGITTFLDRYENCFKKLIIKISKLFPDEQIIVAVNGHFKKEEQIKYLEEINGFCKPFGNVKLITHVEPVGLSKIWNEIVSNANEDKILILNDDLDINPFFREEIKTMVDNEGLTVINKSWSHFVISKNVFSKIGPFDEGLLELGGEDDDYAARCAIGGVKINNKSILSIKPGLKERRKKNIVNSYGKVMSSQLDGYSTINSSYLNTKWERGETYFEGAVHLPDRIPNYWKLKVKE